MTRMRRLFACLRRAFTIDAGSFPGTQAGETIDPIIFG
jgi:hypothetical protein